MTAPVSIHMSLHRVRPHGSVGGEFYAEGVLKNIILSVNFLVPTDDMKDEEHCNVL